MASPATASVVRALGTLSFPTWKSISTHTCHLAPLPPQADVLRRQEWNFDVASILNDVTEMLHPKKPQSLKGWSSDQTPVFTACVDSCHALPGNSLAQELIVATPKTRTPWYSDNKATLPASGPCS